MEGNVVVPHSLSHFGFHLALQVSALVLSPMQSHRISDLRLAMQGSRLALSANVRPGDWLSELDEPGGRKIATRSLVVLQELGPGWLRGEAGPEAPAAHERA